MCKILTFVKSGRCGTVHMYCNNTKHVHDLPLGGMFFHNSLGPLVKKVKDGQIEVIINTLCNNMFSDSESLRDISSVGTFDGGEEGCSGYVWRGRRGMFGGGGGVQWVCLEGEEGCSGYVWRGRRVQWVCLEGEEGCSGYVWREGGCSGYVWRGRRGAMGMFGGGGGVQWCVWRGRRVQWVCLEGEEGHSGVFGGEEGCSGYVWRGKRGAVGMFGGAVVCLEGEEGYVWKGRRVMFRGGGGVCLEGEEGYVWRCCGYV